MGRFVQWMVLLCTLFGLAAMHTLGHTAPGLDAHSHPAAMPSPTLSIAPADAPAAEPTSAVTAVLTVGCAVDGCAGGRHDGRPVWSVCLTVLSGLAAGVLLAASLLGRARQRSRTGEGRAGDVGRRRTPLPRTPASMAVLRI